jgi:hypothetical protein
LIPSAAILKVILMVSQAPVLTPVIPATWEAGIRGSRFEARPGKQFLRPHLQNNGLEVWLKRFSAGFASVKP